MKILSASQMHALDTLTIVGKGITSLQLMENAATCLTQWLTNNLDLKKKQITIYCGTGNNGGDGLAIARMLNNIGCQVKVYAIRPSTRQSPDFAENLKLLKSIDQSLIVDVCRPSDLPTNETPQIIIDAILGSGINRPADGLYAAAIEHINATHATVVSIDTPSGLCDGIDNNFLGVTVIANHTLAIEIPFLNQLQPHNGRFIGNLHIIKIGLSTDKISEFTTPYYLTTNEDVANLLAERPTFSHKGTFGHSLLVAGSYGKAGAAILAAKACHRAGSGLVSVQTPSQCVLPIQIATPETMVCADEQPNFLSQTPETERYTAISIGPGIGIQDSTANMLNNLLKKLNMPITLDADALNIIARNSFIASSIPPSSILTPHPGEFRRLVGEYTPQQRLETLTQFSNKHNCVVVLKGAYTAICRPDGQIHFNTTGNPAMATAGSGDCLTGVITAFMAQGLPPFDAARLGVYVHGLAGDLAAQNIGKVGLTATDIINHIPLAIQKTQQKQ